MKDSLSAVNYLIDGPVLGVWVADMGLAVWVLSGEFGALAGGAVGVGAAVAGP
jgi:hypothetical protein